MKSSSGQYTRGLTTEERFWGKVDKSGPVSQNCPELGPCWNWTGNKTGPEGYGRFYPGGKTGVLAHRFAYQLLTGTIPEGLVIDHLCRNRACVNPSHLEPVTHRVNTLRGEAPAAQWAKRDCCHRCGGELRQRTVQRGKRSGRVVKVVTIRYCPRCNRGRGDNTPLRLITADFP